jgi:hypothetical protein
MSPTTAEEVQNQNQSASGRSDPQTGSGEYNPTRPAAQRLTLENVEEAFTYLPWNGDQSRRGKAVTQALIECAKTILQNVPECPTRTRALNHLIDCRMIANLAITHDGRF